MCEARPQVVVPWTAEEPVCIVLGGRLPCVDHSLLVSLGEGAFIKVDEIERLEAALEIAFSSTPASDIGAEGFAVVTEVQAAPMPE